jgi:hypothetical protein
MRPNFLKIFQRKLHVRAGFGQVIEINNAVPRHWAEYEDVIPHCPTLLAQTTSRRMAGDRAPITTVHLRVVVLCGIHSIAARDELAEIGAILDAGQTASCRRQVMDFVVVSASLGMIIYGEVRHEFLFSVARHCVGNRIAT